MRRWQRALCGLVCAAALAVSAAAQDQAQGAAPNAAQNAAHSATQSATHSAADCPPASQAPTAEERARPAAEARDRGFLWRISKGGRSSWLYGTIHLGRAEWATPGPRVRAALRASEVVALELDLTDPALMERVAQGMAAGAQASGEPLPDDLAGRLQAQLRAACAPLDLLASMSPEMLATTLVMLSARRDGLHAQYGIDPAIAALARRQNKPVVSLETPEQQLRLIRSRTQADLRTSLEEALTDLEQGRTRPLLRRVADAWGESRADEFEHYREWCECADTPAERALLKRVLDERNAPMAARINALHAGGRSVFAAVGSLHMFGPSALPALMARRGYRVERIAFEP